MTISRDALNFGLQNNLYAFVWKAFGTLHPGQAFIPAQHVEAMCYALQRVAEGHCRRLLITVPPRHLKSICTAVGLVAWLLGQDPSHRILVASYGADLAAKHARDFRTVVEAGWYQQLFPRMRIDPKVNREAETMTTAKGGRKAVSLGGAVTGFGADLLIVDDLMKAADAASEIERQRVKDYYEQTLFSRLNDKQSGRIVAIQQRLHEDDFAGYLVDKGNFSHLNLRAIAEQDESFDLYFGRSHERQKGEALFPEREPLATLEEIRRDIREFAFSAQYQQNPVPPGGNRIRWEWFGQYESTRPRAWFQRVVQSWDTALTAEPTSDFSVCMTWGFREGRWYLLDLFRARLEYPDLKRKVVKLRDAWRADKVIVEYANTGMPLIREFRLEGLGLLEPYQPRIDKETRAEVQTAKLETGAYLLPKEGPWLGDLKRELLAFPNGRYDDQVDSLIQFLDWIGSRRGRGFMDRDPRTGRPYGQRYRY
jgi:predicted phage terminase large subunit-like protein